MDVLLAQPRGFCAGVVRAVEIVERALALHGRPVYVYHEIVHNRHVVDGLRERGAVFVETLDEIPRGAVTVFSAHGVSQAVVAGARARDLRVIDATCPLVEKVHRQAQRFAAEARTVIIIGHRGHEEIDGTLGSIRGPALVVEDSSEVAALDLPADARLAYVTQTTLSLDDTREIIGALRRRWPSIEGPGLDDICYATQNRQQAVRELAAEVDLVLVVGSRNSSNSNRLREVASDCGVPAYLIEEASELETHWLEGASRVGLTAGASAPEILVAGVLARLKALGATSERQVGSIRESVSFRLPPEVARVARTPVTA